MSELAEMIKIKILDLAICGKLVLQDPNGEPASVLLERIRAEKEELIKQGKIKRDKKESILFKGDDNSYYETDNDITINIDNELPFIIPNHWTWCRLKNLAKVEENSLIDGKIQVKNIQHMRIQKKYNDVSHYLVILLLLK